MKLLWSILSNKSQIVVFKIICEKLSISFDIYSINNKQEMQRYFIGSELSKPQFEIKLLKIDNEYLVIDNVSIIKQDAITPIYDQLKNKIEELNSKLQELTTEIESSKKQQLQSIQQYQQYYENQFQLLQGQLQQLVKNKLEINQNFTQAQEQIRADQQEQIKNLQQNLDKFVSQVVTQLYPKEYFQKIIQDEFSKQSELKSNSEGPAQPLQNKNNLNEQRVRNMGNNRIQPSSNQENDIEDKLTERNNESSINLNQQILQDTLLLKIDKKNENQENCENKNQNISNSGLVSNLIERIKKFIKKIFSYIGKKCKDACKCLHYIISMIIYIIVIFFLYFLVNCFPCKYFSCKCLKSMLDKLENKWDKKFGKQYLFNKNKLV
eukprot:TRINITY_DN3763_c0_g1_i2.p1 TRINITY_DN3763_c0_g1~~TRINITY_DN3763_c0_g1_i2.p1  ORF type:complete len:380 (-),score=49.34 TRINITY_DN3763_c0_g1_i2:330-1469(-)